MPLNIFANELSKDYCIGYFEEVYWSLDPIEEEETRMNITSFFNDRFEGADQLNFDLYYNPCLLYTSPSPRDATLSRMPSSA